MCLHHQKSNSSQFLSHLIFCLFLSFFFWFTVGSQGLTACWFRPVDNDLLSYKSPWLSDRRTDREKIKCELLLWLYLWWALCSYSSSLIPLWGVESLKSPSSHPVLIKPDHTGDLPFWPTKALQPLSSKNSCTHHWTSFWASLAWRELQEPVLLGEAKRWEE